MTRIKVFVSVAALVATAALLMGCSDVGGEIDVYYDKYEVTQIELTDGRTIECVYFGAHSGFDCNWDYEK